MSTAAKKSKVEHALQKALDAEPKDIKVHISLRLDSDIYLELQRRADAGEANGKYQTLLNDLLRSALFESRKSDYIVEVTKSESHNIFDQLLNSYGIVMHKKVKPKSAGKKAGVQMLHAKASKSHSTRSTKKHAKPR